MSLLQQLRVLNLRLQDENTLRLDAENQNLELVSSQEILERKNRELLKRLEQAFCDMDFLSRQIQDLEEMILSNNVVDVQLRPVDSRSSLGLPSTANVMVQTTAVVQFQDQNVAKCSECLIFKDELRKKANELVELGVLLSSMEEALEASKLEQTEVVNESIAMKKGPDFQQEMSFCSSFPPAITEVELDLKYLENIGGTIQQYSAIPLHLNESLLNHSPSLRKCVEDLTDDLRFENSADIETNDIIPIEGSQCSDVERRSFFESRTSSPTKQILPSSFSISSQKSHMELSSNTAMVESLTFTMIGSWVSVDLNLVSKIQ